MSALRLAPRRARAIAQRAQPRREPAPPPASGGADKAGPQMWRKATLRNLDRDVASTQQAGEQLRVHARNRRLQPRLERQEVVDDERLRPVLVDAAKCP